MLTGVSSCGVVAQAFFERYTPLLMKARTDFPTHFLKVYSAAVPLRLASWRLSLSRAGRDPQRAARAVSPPRPAAPYLPEDGPRCPRVGRCSAHPRALARER